MANITKWIIDTPYSAANLADNTNLASKTNGTYGVCQVSAADTVIDNATNKDLYMGVVIALGSWTPTTSDKLELYTLYSGDGTNYETGSGSYLPEPDRLWKPKMLSTDTVAQAKTFFLWAPILPFKFKMIWRWMGTNATAASGNSLSYTTFNENLNG